MDVALMDEDDLASQHSLPLNVEVVKSGVVGDNDSTRLLDEILLEEVVTAISNGVADGDEFATPVSILNGPSQATLLALLVVFSIFANACVINNIRHNCIKLRSTHFILIQHLCVADLIGASLILPAPLVTSFRGRWEGGSTLCHLSSVVNVSLWLQHVFMFLMLKVWEYNKLSFLFLYDALRVAIKENPFIKHHVLIIRTFTGTKL